MHTITTPSTTIAALKKREAGTAAGHAATGASDNAPHDRKQY